LSDHPIASYQPQQDGNDSNDQQNMNQIARRENKKAEEPAYYQDYSNKVKHSITFKLINYFS
jgi:hypothetical protein